jgi:uncharacterized membrane protein
MFKKNLIKYFILVSAAAIIFTGGLWAKMSRQDMESGNSLVTFKVVKAVDSLVKLPAADFDSGKAKFYIYRLPDVSIRFFVVKASDGSLKAAFDACIVCYRANKGYHQDGDSMACNNCDNHFPIDGLNDARKGCNPVYLPLEIQKDKVIIKVKNLKEGAALFAL